MSDEGNDGGTDAGPESARPAAADAGAADLSASRGHAVPYVRMRWHRAGLRLDYAGRSFRYRFDGNDGVTDPRPFVQRLFIDRIDKARTVRLLEKAGVVYMLVDVQGPSRGPLGAELQCGAGTEEALVLFAFTRSGEVRPPQDVLTNSCWWNIDDTDPDFQSPIDAHLVGRLGYVVSSDDGGYRDVQVHVAFDPDHPDAGFTFAQRCRRGDVASPCPP